ncbi:hypothetical protein Val02_02680 [Virgisporangium aliadipatigenens]|uniref:Hsp70 protein n=2 Tax=Virgisporangium aliadipatigenens TaxID=741659 RepID=A0A8J3YFB6_9ACTN|nr:hypothetical protein Val02_02680 [Virgisporangium aliadipatigenens]
MLQWPDGRVRPLLFDGSPLLSSAVLLGADTRLHTGRDATYLGRGTPERMEPNPKRRVDDDTVLLGEREVPVRDLLAAVLTRVATEAQRVAGRIGEVVLTHPAAWGSRRVGLLVEAAGQAGLGRPHLVGEPLAAATYFARLGGPFATAARVLVYDLGAGTFDVTLLRRHAHGFEIVRSDGLNDVGGLDIDAAIVAFLQATYGQPWNDAVSRRQLWEDVRGAKEMLSRASSTVITLPTTGTEVPLGREQFDGLVAPVLRPTVSMTRALLRDAGAEGGETALVLVGGASRVPLVATMLQEALGLAPIVIEQPELVVAEGALYSLPGGPDPAAAPAGSPASGGPSAPVSGPAGPSVPVSGAVGAGGYGGDGTGGYGPSVPGSGVFGVTGTGAGVYGAPASGAGAYGAAAPVSGAAGPISGAGGPVPGGAGPVPGGAPVSGAAGGYGAGSAGAFGGAAPGGPGVYGGPGPGGFPGGGPQGFGHGPAVRPPRPARSGAAVGVTAAVAVLVVLGLLVGIGVVGWLVTRGDDTGNRATGGPSAGPTTGREAAGSPTGRQNAQAKYEVTVIPENPCSKVDIGAFAQQFSEQSIDPTASRQLTTGYGYGSCSHSRTRNTTEAVLTLTYTLSVFDDPNVAVTTQKQAYDNAKLNSQFVPTISGLGEEAYLTDRVGSAATSDRDVNYTLEMRDGNLRWSVLLIASSVTGGPWTEQQRAQFRTDLEASVRGSHKNLTG